MSQQTPCTNMTKGRFLYEQDYYLWLITTIEQLRDGQLADIDFDKLIEELEDICNSQKSNLKRNLRLILMHLLMCTYQPRYISSKWLYTILKHRTRIEESFSNSPSLKAYFDEIFTECYDTARKLAASETGLPIEVFPQASPFTPAQVLDLDYFPE